MSYAQTHAPALPRHIVTAAVGAALAEDLGQAGDLTSQATLSPSQTARAAIVSRSDGIVCGLACARAAFAMVGDGLTVDAKLADGARLTPGAEVLSVTGNAQTLLSGERVALNFMTHLSGVASLTTRFVAAVAGTGARICCTRKTTPGLRALEKHAVRVGGGINHRFGLSDAILIKDNHIAVAGGVRAALAAAQAFAGHMVAVEIEVDTLAQLEEALAGGAKAVLLDNMAPDTLREAVALNAGRATLEASGTVTLETVRAIAETGVDYISTSRITMAAPPLDLGLDISMGR